MLRSAIGGPDRGADQADLAALPVIDDGMFGRDVSLDLQSNQKMAQRCLGLAAVKSDAE
jgi:hypothetical protein